MSKARADQGDALTMTRRLQSDEIDLGYLVAVFLDNKLVIVMTTLVFMVSGAVSAILETPQYRADALMQVETRSNSLSSLEIAGLGQSDTSTSTQSEILKSRMIMARAAAQAGLDFSVRPRTVPVIGDALIRYGVTRPQFAEGWASVWAGETIEVSSFQVPQNNSGQTVTLTVLDGERFALHDAQANLIGEGRSQQPVVVEDPFLELTVQRIDAAPGAQFTLQKRSDMDMINYLQSRFEVSPRGQDTGILELALTGPDRSEIVRSLDAIAQVYLVQNIDRQAAEAESRLQFLEQQAPMVFQQLTEAEDSLNTYRTSQDSVDISFETQAMLERLVSVEQQLSALELEESGLRQRFTSSHPTFQAFLLKREQLEKEMQHLEEQAEALPETQRQVLRLNRDVEVSQGIYMQMLNTLQELRIARAGTIGNVRILDNAVAGNRPIAPRKSVVTVTYTAIGLVLSLLLVFVKKLLHRRVETVDQLKEIGLAVYATVPLSKVQLDIMQKAKARTSASDSGRLLGRFKLLVDPDRHQNWRSKSAKGLLAVSNPTDVSIEALRSLRTSLHFAMLDAANKCIMLTGPSPMAGKTFISANLAAVCAQAGQKVLLIDADMRKGHAHTIFDDANETGLSDILSGKATIAEVIRTSQQAQLDFITRGSLPPNPSELLTTRNFSQLLEHVNKQYDLVIIDTPPVLAATDAAIAGRHCGTCFLVVRFQMNPPREVESALEQLKTAGVEVKGAILNAVERTAATGYGYDYRYYNYGYESDKA
jgi:tyrosine-protein kinase Etk/Wzc